jgi:hypothetical protein
MGKAALVVKLDELRGESIKAFVLLVPVMVLSEELAEKLKNFVKEHLSATSILGKSNSSSNYRRHQVVKLNDSCCGKDR